MPAFHVKDTALAATGKLRVEWAEQEMPVLRQIRARFAQERPLAEQRIGACLHVTTDTANLMLTNSESPCVVVTDTPAGDAFCYKCHGTGSTLPMGDLSGFENSAHSNVAAPPLASLLHE